VQNDELDTNAVGQRDQTTVDSEPTSAAGVESDQNGASPSYPQETR
jgi:hypothetical protein